MRPDEIKEHLRTQPFRPIRIYVTDGSSYEVHHPELVFVTRMDVVEGLNPTDEIPDRSVYIDPIHITRIEPSAHRRSANGRRK
jgi:hypothetical protein